MDHANNGLDNPKGWYQHLLPGLIHSPWILFGQTDIIFYAMRQNFTFSKLTYFKNVFININRNRQYVFDRKRHHAKYYINTIYLMETNSIYTHEICSVDREIELMWSKWIYFWIPQAATPIQILEYSSEMQAAPPLPLLQTMKEISSKIQQNMQM